MFTGTSEGSVNTRAQCVLSQVASWLWVQEGPAHDASAHHSSTAALQSETSWDSLGGLGGRWRWSCLQLQRQREAGLGEALRSGPAFGSVWKVRQVIRVLISDPRGSPLKS